MNVLIVEDERSHTPLVEDAIRREWPEAGIQHVNCAGDAVTAIKATPPDLVVSDLFLSGFSDTGPDSPPVGSGYTVAKAANGETIPCVVIAVDLHTREVPHAVVLHTTVGAEEFQRMLVETLKKLLQGEALPIDPGRDASAAIYWSFVSLPLLTGLSFVILT